MTTLAALGGARVVTTVLQPIARLEDHAADALHRAIDAARLDVSTLSSLSGGGTVKAFEEDFARSVGTAHALALSSGTAALQLALRICGVRRGDDVVVPSYSWGQTVGPVLHVGARPVFADIDLHLGTLTAAAIESRITGRTRAVIVVHTFGQPAPMASIRALCLARGLRLIEDAAHAHGAVCEGTPVGAWGDASCFSLGRGKPVSGGEGGVLCTASRRDYELAVAHSQHPLRASFEAPSRMRRIVGEFGRNFRIHPLAAVMARAELKDAELRLSRRTAFYEQLSQMLSDVPGVRVPATTPGGRHAWYRYCPLYVPEEIAAGRVPRAVYLGALAAEGVPVGIDPIGSPLHRREAVTRIVETSTTPCPNTDERCGLTGLAFAPWLPDVGDARSIAQIREAFLKVTGAASQLI